jgi:hypothetical protein
MIIMGETLDKLVKEAHEERVVYHVSRNSTAIEAWERVEKKAKEEGKGEKKRRRRPKKGEKRPPKEESVLERQVHERAEEAVEKIDTACAPGCKKNSHGNTQFRTGYRLHPDVSDCGFPLSAFVSGANVHDSQIAIPLEKMTEDKVYFYTAIRFNHSKPSRRSGGAMILGGGGLQVHKSRIEPLVRRVVFIICNI